MIATLPIRPTRRWALQAAAVQLVTVSAAFGWLWARGAPADGEPGARLRQALTLLQDSERLRGELGVGSGSRAAQAQRLAQIAANDAALAALLAAHVPVARTAAFGAQAERFQVYAVAWRERHGSVNGGDAFMPEGLSDALQAELAALS